MIWWSPRDKPTVPPRGQMDWGGKTAAMRKKAQKKHIRSWIKDYKNTTRNTSIFLAFFVIVFYATSVALKKKKNNYLFDVSRPPYQPNDEANNSLTQSGIKKAFLRSSSDVTC